MAEKPSASSSQTLPARVKTAAAAPGLKRKESDDFDDYFVSLLLESVRTGLRVENGRLKSHVLRCPTECTLCILANDNRSVPATSIITRNGLFSYVSKEASRRR